MKSFYLKEERERVKKAKERAAKGCSHPGWVLIGTSDLGDWFNCTACGTTRVK